VAQSPNRTRKSAGSKARNSGRASAGTQASSAGEYAREALTEWGKAARFGAAALLASGGSGKSKSKSKEDKPPLTERLNPATTEKGGRIGDAADNMLSKFGVLGKAASKMSLGSRAIDKVVPDALTKLQPSGGNGGGSKTGTDSQGHPPVPIQESIDLAVPIGTAFALATRFDHFSQWSDRIEGAEELDETHVALDLKLRGTQRSVELELSDVQEPLRIEWEATAGAEGGGMVSFHELAPSLTHVELSIDLEPESPVQRLSRTIHLPERAIRSELHLFKAWAELWQEVEDIEPPEEPEDEIEEEPSDEEEFEEPEDEEDLEEEPEDEFEDGPEDEFEDDEEPEDEFDDEFEDEEEFEEPEDEFVDEEDEDFEEEDFDEEGEPASTR
jgi:uncharacterized membrane protein